MSSFKFVITLTKVLWCCEVNLKQKIFSPDIFYMSFIGSTTIPDDIVLIKNKGYSKQY